MILINLSFHLLSIIPWKFVMLVFSFLGEHIDQENNLQLLRRLNLIGWQADKKLLNYKCGLLNCTNKISYPKLVFSYLSDLL